MIYSIANGLGFYNAERICAIDPSHLQVEPIKQKKYTLQAKKWLNLAIFAGYIPLVGTITGIARMIIFNQARKEMNSANPEFKSFLKWNIARGGVEFSSFGILLLIPDLIVTLIVFRKSNHMNTKSN